MVDIWCTLVSCPTCPFPYMDCNKFVSCHILEIKLLCTVVFLGFFFRTDMCKGALSAREQVFLNSRTQFFGMHPYIGSMIKHIPADSRTEIVVGIETLGAQGKLCYLCFLWGHPSRLKAHGKWWSWFLWNQPKGLPGKFHIKQKGCWSALLSN